MVIPATILALLVIAALGLHLQGHRAAKKTIAREASRWEWDDARQVHEIRAMKRRHGLRAKARRIARRS